LKTEEKAAIHEKAANHENELLQYNNAAKIIK